MYVKKMLHQLAVAVNSAIDMLEQTPDELLDWRPAENKRPIRDMFVHLAVLCKADYYIMEGYSQEDMSEFYTQAQPFTKQDIKGYMRDSFSFLNEKVNNFTESQLREEKPSYWGIVYTRFEWLLEILSHYYHHRGQIHALLTVNGCSIDVKLFE
ncbi:DinB family protein [Peribacillus cavernae]|nr:DinB family protein [Peribacillus cavernae]MDQ0220460.1 putative damage-inducible protein DinB [Peribacillus cavernae]